MKEDLNVMFCPKCHWHLINAEDKEKYNECPRCGTWTYEIFQNYFYKNGKEIGAEFGITDNDEVFFQAYDHKEARKLIEKAFKVFDMVRKPSEVRK